MTPQDFDYLHKLLRERSGLLLSAEKQYLAESRLLPVARKHGFAGLGELVGKLKATTAAAPFTVEVVEAMTTNESFFFRDKVPFEHFRLTIMPALLAARAREAHPHLVHGGRHRLGALFAGDKPEEYRASARRLARGYPRHRHFQRSAGEG